jgi:TolB protein
LQKQPFSPLIPPMTCRVLIILLAVAWPIMAQEPATITIRKGDTTHIALKALGGADGALATRVLQNDLEMSGLFAISPPDRASFVASGSAGGGSLEGRVVDGRGATVLEKRYSGNARAAAHEFADDILETLTGQKGIASSKIAFVASRTGRKEIYLADYDGANVQQLTRDGAISVAPAISRDATQIAYTGYQSGYADIYLINLSSGSRNRIVKFPGTNSGASFSPEGGRIACSVSRDGNPELYVVTSSGGGARRLTKTRGVESSPTWSPDGREIIYSSDTGGSPQLYRIPSGGGTGSLIPTGYSYSTEPSWSPDGSKLAFTARQGGFSIAVKNLKTGATQVVAGGGEDPAWGANSRHLVFSNGSSIVLLDTVTGRSVPVISGLGKVSEPSWSH